MLSESLVKLNEVNLEEFSLALGSRPGGATYVGEDLKWSYSGIPGCNRVLGARLTEEDVDARIAELSSKFLSKGGPCTWIVGPSTVPADLGERLVKHGFQPMGEWTGMSLAMADIPEDWPMPEGLVIEEVTDVSLLPVWSATVIAGFGAPESAYGIFGYLFAELGIGEGTPWKHYLGYLNGSPATAATVFRGSNATGVYIVATLPQARGRGLGTAITRHALLGARPWGHEVAVLQATAMGKSVYARIGFKDDCKMNLYMLRK